MPLRRLWYGTNAMLLCAVLLGHLEPLHARGHLFIIGGGKRTPEMMRRFVHLAGGPHKANLVVLPMASAIPESSGSSLVAEFRRLGVLQVVSRSITREQAMTDSVSDSFHGVTGVYFAGGVQERLAAALVGTRLQKTLKNLYDAGAVIGGTSAGAAIMSKIMITGRELLDSDTANAFSSIKADNIETIEGLAFIEDAIVDQHFVRRKRNNRLVSLVLEHPRLLGVGVDESTVLIVRPDHIFEVFGENTVVIYDASQATGIKTDRNGNLSGHGVRMHILSSGERFDIERRKVVPASAPAREEGSEDGAAARPEDNRARPVTCGQSR